MTDFFLYFLSEDPSLGKVDKSSLSQQTLMELFIENITNKQEICGSTDTPKDTAEWEGLTFDDSNDIIKVEWDNRGLRGSIALQWLPPTVTSVIACFNGLSGTIDLTCLPGVFRVLNLALNAFEGTLDLTKLPDGMTFLNIYGNNFTGLTDFSQIPKSLSFLNVGKTKLEGEISVLNGYCNTDSSRVQDLRNKKD